MIAIIRLFWISIGLTRIIRLIRVSLTRQCFVRSKVSVRNNKSKSWHKICVNIRKKSDVQKRGGIALKDSRNFSRSKVLIWKLQMALNIAINRRPLVTHFWICRLTVEVKVRIIKSMETLAASLQQRNRLSNLAKKSSSAIRMGLRRSLQNSVT